MLWMQIVSTQLQTELRVWSVGEKWHGSLWKCSLVMYSLRPHIWMHALPCPRLCLLPQGRLRLRMPCSSQLSGDDGEGEHRAAGLQLQGGEEAVHGCFVLALVL